MGELSKTNFIQNEKEKTLLIKKINNLHERSIDENLERVDNVNKQPEYFSYKLGLLAELKHDYEMAEVYYKRANRLNLDNEEFRSALFYVRRKLGGKIDLT